MGDCRHQCPPHARCGLCAGAPIPTSAPRQLPLALKAVRNVGLAGDILASGSERWA